MKRSGAIGVVVGVLAVASLLMYFVVMPQIRENKTVEDLAKKAGETVEQAQKALNDAGKQVEEAAEGGQEAKAAVVAKMARLKADADAAASEMQVLLDKGVPTAEQVDAAKAKIEAALKAASEIKLPEGIDTATAALVDRASEGAKAALATIEKLPADPDAARSALADVKAAIASAMPGTAADVSKTTAKTEDGSELSRSSDEARSPMPAFDIVRVEKDGSTVIAGRADPGAEVEIVDGGKVIASAEADDTGAFAAVLDDPLSQGDHSIVLKSTTKDGKSTISDEVATVSVPRDGSGELLAMVTKPGEASKIITMPEAADKATEMAANKAVTAEPTKTADGTVTTPDLPALSSEIAGDPPVVAGVAKTAEQPASAPEVLVSAVEIEGDRIFIAGNTSPGATVRVYADDKIVAEVKADKMGRFVADNRMPLAVGNHTIRADVLSADGAKVEFRASVPFFRPEGDLAAVASADPAKDQPAMEPLSDGTFDKARNEAGKALGLLKNLYAEGKTPTPEELAAARSSTEIALKTLSEVRVAGNSDPALVEMASKASEEAAKALAALKALPADTATVQAALGAIEKNVSAALKPATELAVTDPAKPADEAKVSDTSRTPEDGSAVAGMVDAGEVTDKDTPKDMTADAATTEVSKTADGSASAAEQEETAGDAADAAPDVAAADQPKIIEQAPLTQSEGSVIIRRGDTLWQISRRVYGKGVRYTTIYVANQGQITDPDRILPGQLFTMPGKWLDNAEELHKERLQHRKN